MNRVTENNFYEEENYNVVLKVYIFVEGEGGGSFLLVKILRPVL